MTKTIASRIQTSALLGLAALALSAAPALATVFYVSGAGNNAAACTTVQAPCLTLQAAHNKAAAGDEIVVLNAANYGPLTITKSIAIVNDSAGVADIAATSGSAITINAGGSDTVHLRGLSLDGGGTASAGVRVNSLGWLTIVNCVARRFTVGGYYLAPTTPLSFAFTNAVAADGNNGFYVFPQGAGAAKGVFARINASGHSQYGVLLRGAAVNASLVDSVANKNLKGVAALEGAALMARDAVSSNNSGPGFIVATGGAILRLAHTVASGNAQGVYVGAGGTAESYGDNNLRGNGVAVSGVLATVAQQ